MKIAVEGCAHGELDNIYETIKYLEEKQGFKIDLLICCGDFQASRNEGDLRCMAVPPKYYKMCSFYKYYTGEKIAPVLTIFIGGNHEASNYLQELPYGGWVAPKIFYMGYAGVINIAGVRIGGLSGIYKAKDYMKGHFEFPPYNDGTKRSVYHIRNLEVFRLKQLSQPIDISISHDWPSGVWEYGNKKQLIRFKPFFEEDMKNGQLGSKPTEELLNTLKPDYWFAAHLHCKFAAVIPHNCDKVTKFLALDKCLPNRRFLQVVDVPHNSHLKIDINYDLEWLTILRLTNHLLSVKNVFNYLPGPSGSERWCFTPTEAEKLCTSQFFGNDLVVPNNFQKTADGYLPQNNSKNCQQPHAVANPQTVLFCKKLGIDDPLNILLDLDITDINASNNVEGVTELSLDNQSFIDDTELSIPSTVQQKMALNLPEPINDQETLSDEIVDGNKAKIIETSQNEISGDDHILSDVENSVKKFKRRNASLYENSDVDS